MRIVLKIIAAPFVAISFVLCLFITFVFCWAKVLVEIASGLVMLVAILLFIMGEVTGGIVFTVIAFLLSPLGIPAIGEWLVDKLGDLSASLVGFMAN